MMKALPLALALLLPSLQAAEFKSNWSGTRPWVGPEYWGNPLYDWETKDGAVVAHAAKDRLLHLLTHQVGNAETGFSAEVEVDLAPPDKVSNPTAVWAGLAVGVRGMMDDPRHVAVGAKEWIEAGIRADGRLILGKEAVSDKPLGGKGPVRLELRYASGELSLQGTRGERTANVSLKCEAAELKGNLCLAAMSPRRAEDKRGPILARFRDWKVGGDGVVETGVEPFGPILWTQYTRQGSTVKLQAQMGPVGKNDSQEAVLELKEGGKWKEAAKASIDGLSRTALFRVEVPKGPADYRVTYPWAGGVSEWSGRIIEDPARQGGEFRVGVFSCDHGYAFPLPTMTRNVAVQDPHLMFFAGDQIYEGYGGFGVVRAPVEKAALDYLRKYYQFGWTWRELLKDRPSVILPDDHDVFQGNLWGAGGGHVKRIDEGGYIMAPAWVKAVERTQTGHLPDPVDPAPIKGGIGVYFTEMTWGGVPIAILEDRKWKSGPLSVLPKNRMQLKPEEVDVPGASMLGERQEKFLGEWSTKTEAEPVRLVLSQTIFCKGHTHTGPELKKNRFDWDSNGWPQSGRRRALEPLKGDNTLMLHGDQHLGLLVRQGVDDWGDGPWAMMVPGTSNGWPRAWWPESGSITGDFTDPFGNKFSVLAAANPEKGSNRLNPRATDPPEKVAQLKGSGHGIVKIAPDRKSAVIEMWRYAFDAKSPKPGDQFEGFPQILHFGKE
ncbi:hypothetical protein HAHE_25580 [Haloferula helveola]|uniref:PhoD-like phosphatase metallophosphatase domain-containing protein n=1 Tax=Haloferula helveola TaxID=490095 RepID=A0ABM7RDP0_9BACT|nr:hypothetical protein HAHE_25580 [Haloferula helveola]